MSRDMLDCRGGWIASKSDMNDARDSILMYMFPPSVSQESKQQILQPLSVLRPKFRVRHLVSLPRTSSKLIQQAIAQSLRDIASPSEFIARSH